MNYLGDPTVDGDTADIEKWLGRRTASMAGREEAQATYHVVAQADNASGLSMTAKFTRDTVVAYLLFNTPEEDV